MSTCLITDHSEPRDHRRHWIVWDDANGYHAGIVAEQSNRPRRDQVTVSQSTTDTSKSLADWAATLPYVTNIRDRTLTVNQYRPRIYRPWTTGVIQSVVQDDQALEQSVVAIEILVDSMHSLFRVLEPDVANLPAFGHEIRNLLLLACMEVEAGLSAVLRANGETQARLNTADYVRLLSPLHLSDYQLRLSSYPTLRVFRPFGTWNAAAPTQSLPWYDAYNQAKHDREGNFAEATLEHAIEAVVAAVIVFYAQFGRCDIQYGWTDLPRFRAFGIYQWPVFAVDEWYVFCPCGMQFEAVPYPL